MDDTDIDIDRFLDEQEEISAPAEKPVNLRRAHQCRCCDSRAQWEAYLHVRYGLHHKAIETMKWSHRVCDMHRKEVAARILSPANKKLISTKLATIGRLSIDWDNAMIEFVPCGEKPWTPTNMQELKVA